jgi:hypothetical protein
MATDAPPEDQARDETEFCRQWLEAIRLSEDEEKDWTQTAERACDTYRSGKQGSATETNLCTFNIFHSNVETLVPAVYNSTPVPDVRRRFNDDDPIAKDVSELLERSLSFQIDAYDFDHIILTAVRDMAIVSRGVARVRYVPSFGADGTVAYEVATCEHVPWRTFRRGPGKTWDDVPWIAFENYLSYGEVEKLVEDEKDKELILKELKFSYSAEPKKTNEEQADNLSKLAARARVWEIWDKDNKEVHFIAPDYNRRRLTTIDDPLALDSFYPIPRPLAAIMAPDSMVPITLIQIYEQLLEELNIVQRRIMRLTKQLRVRGWYAGLNAEDVKLAAEADDGEMIALSGAETFITQGTGLDKAIQYWPIETISVAIKQLVEQRDTIKATIYEVTGLSDIIRGATNANETATAQQIKSQWGSLRIQKMQGEVARFVRDLFRLKAEVMSKKFDIKTFEMMTGLVFPAEAEKQQAQQMLQLAQQMQQQPDSQLAEVLSKPSKEQIVELLKNNAMRQFRVDIESDSTVRGDLQKNQEQMSLFLQGTAQYLSAVGPLVQAKAMPKDLAIEIYAGFARSFKLGKQAEDALDRLADQAKQPQQEQPTPEEMKAQADMAKIQMEMKAKQEEHQMKMQEMQAKLQMQREELMMKREELNMRREEMQLDMQIAQQDAALKQHEMQQDAVMSEQQHAMDMTAAHEKHQLNMQGMKEKAQFQRQQQKQKQKAA